MLCSRPPKQRGWDRDSSSSWILTLAVSLCTHNEEYWLRCTLQITRFFPCQHCITQFNNHFNNIFIANFILILLSNNTRKFNSGYIKGVLQCRVSRKDKLWQCRNERRSEKLLKQKLKHAASEESDPLHYSVLYHNYSNGGLKRVLKSNLLLIKNLMYVEFHFNVKVNRDVAQWNPGFHEFWHGPSLKKKNNNNNLFRRPKYFDALNIQYIQEILITV